MKKFIIIIFTLIAGAVSAEVKALRNIDIGDPYPPFCAQQLNGAEICSSKYKNTILVVAFVKIVQKQFQKIMVNLQELHTQYNAKNVSIICIVSGEIDLQRLIVFTDGVGLSGFLNEFDQLGKMRLGFVNIDLLLHIQPLKTN